MGRKQSPNLLYDKTNKIYYRYANKDGKYRKVSYGPDKARAYQIWAKEQQVIPAMAETALAVADTMPLRLQIEQRLAAVVAETRAILDLKRQLDEADSKIIDFQNLSAIPDDLGEQAKRYTLAVAALPDSPAKIDNTPTVKEIVDYYVDFLKINRSPDHCYDAGNTLGFVVDYFGADTRIGSITHAMVIEFRDFITRQVRKETFGQPKANKIIALWKAAVNRRVKDKNDVPAESQRYLNALEKKKTETAKQTEILTREQLKTILTSGTLYWKTAVVLGLNMAASNIDMSEIEYGHILFDKGYIDFSRNKNKRPRRIPLWAKTVDLLNEYKREYKTKGRIFRNSKGGDLITYGEKGKRDNLSVQFPKAMQELGINNITWKSIRKTTATYAAIGGAADSTIEMITGDADSKVWKRYVVAIPQVVETAIKAVESAMGLA